MKKIFSYLTKVKRWSEPGIASSMGLSLLLIFALNSSALGSHSPDPSAYGDLNALFQQQTVTGTVVDGVSGQPLPGVNIVVAGIAVGAVTDGNGRYSINVPGPDATLTYSFIGYETQNVVVGAQTIIDVIMMPEAETLEEIVVIGYGSMERSNVTGAITSIRAEELSDIPVTNVIEALRGQVAGVQITKGSGKPGEAVEFTIRGKNSLGVPGSGIAVNEPLIVLDGVPMTGGNFAEINPADIASIDILKDAGAASIYGASAANGVILITTKTGSARKPTVSVNASYGITNLTHRPEMFDADGYVQLKKDAARNAGLDTSLAAVLTDPVESANYAEGKTVDWHEVLLSPGSVTDLSISTTGGTDNFQYYMNGAVYLEDGIVTNTDYNRYSYRMNADYKPYKFITLGAKMQFTRADADETGTAAVWYQNAPDFTDFLGNTPLGRTHNEEGQLVPTVKGDQFQYNPLYKYQESSTDRSNTRVFLNPYLEFKILDGLTFRTNGFVEQRTEQYSRFESSMYGASTLEDPPGQNFMRFQTTYTTTMLLDNILSYDKLFSDKHRINATLVYGFQTYSSYRQDIQGDSAGTDLLGTYGINGVPDAKTRVGLFPDDWGKVYFAGRLGYTFGSKYAFTATIRRDGSSKFGADYKWGIFPSGSFAWNIHNESFLEDNALISLMKFRISYGIMGNDRIPNFQYVANSTDVFYPFGSRIFHGFIEDNYANPTLRWEKSNQFNTGIDFGLYNDRITGSIDYFNTRTTDLLLTEKIPIVTGFTEVVSNVGETANWGIEASVDARILDGDLKWDIGINWAKDKNRIVRLRSTDVDSLGNPTDDIDNGWFIGQDINVIYDYDFTGVYQATTEDSALARQMHPRIPRYGPGDPRIRDVTGDTVITSEDRTFLGSPTPSWYGGIRNTFSYKGFKLTVIIETVQGVVKMNSFINSLTGRDNTVKVNYWTPENPSNEFPYPHASREYRFINAVRMQDASFVSIRNVSLEYSLPRSVLNNSSLRNVSFYVRGNNLHYFTDYVQAYSPESNAGAFPTVRTITFGTNITF